MCNDPNEGPFSSWALQFDVVKGPSRRGQGSGEKSEETEERGLEIYDLKEFLVNAREKRKIENGDLCKSEDRILEHGCLRM